MRVVDSELHIVDIEVSGRVVKIHQACGEVFWPTVVTNEGMEIGASKNSAHDGVGGIRFPKTGGRR